MPLFTQNGSLLRAGNSLRGCCCDHIEPPPPPPPPEPPGPEPPPPPIPPGDPPEFGGGCCLSTGSGWTGEPNSRMIFYGNRNIECDNHLGFHLDGDHTCSDNREQGLRDEYITGVFSVGCQPTWRPEERSTSSGQDRGRLIQTGFDAGSLGTTAAIRTFYNRYSSCSGDAVDDNARTPQTLVTYTVLDGVASINGRLVSKGQSISTGGGVGGIPFNPNPGRQDDYTGGRIDLISGHPHTVLTYRNESGFIVPHHTRAAASVFSVHRLTWYHHDDYDVYVHVACAGSDLCS